MKPSQTCFIQHVVPYPYRAYRKYIFCHNKLRFFLNVYGNIEIFHIIGKRLLEVVKKLWLKKDVLVLFVKKKSGTNQN